jgi:hypothetical protein
MRIVFTFLVAATLLAQPAQPRSIEFLFTSDAHYGLTRAAFRGGTNVDAHVVNAAMVARMNTIVDPIDFVVEAGDIANREETAGGVNGGAIQPAAASWAQFKADYIDGLTLHDRTGAHSALYAVPGNHDVTNAVGFYKPMMPLIDNTSMVEIYNRMMRPAAATTAATYEYARDRILTSRDVGGVHLIFVTVWPDSLARQWMENDLRNVAATTPVFLFTHDQPDAEAKHFINPNGRHDINAEDKFENLLADQFADGPSINDESRVEQRALAGFLRQHPNITAYFHGNSNWNEFYDWPGPNHSIALHTFRVDSPIKGNVSAKDETKLSFQVAVVDMNTRTLTVRECLWNTNSKNPAAPVAWGASRTVSIAPGH